MTNILPPLNAEWLETDGLGGFSSGTVRKARSRRYHALLNVALRPPTDRVVLVNGLETWVQTSNGQFPLSTQHYAPGVDHPAGEQFLVTFTTEPWPTWRWTLPDGVTIERQLFMPHGRPAVATSWRLIRGNQPVRLFARPLLSGRDHHHLHHENPDFRFATEFRDGGVLWHPYASLPAIFCQHNGAFRLEPLWYRQFLYVAERERGLDDIEDLASPGVLSWNLTAQQPAIAIFAAILDPGRSVAPLASSPDAELTFAAWESAERQRRDAFASPLERAADQYIVRRVGTATTASGQSIIAGYPWFTDWGRDTFIAMRGLCLALGRFDVAEDILVAWSQHVSEGMIPNRFPDHAAEPEYNSVDASLWYVIVACEFLAAAAHAGYTIEDDRRQQLIEAVLAILAGYHQGTRYRIHCDTDGLLAAGEPGVQLTWMDAKVGDWVVTPRSGKPVELQALWLNALRLGAEFDPQWTSVLDRGYQSFAERFWNGDQGCLFDVIDIDHQRGVNDSSVRVNQVLAVGGLPFAVLKGARAAAVVRVAEERLWTPAGPRTLAPGSINYSPRYSGGVLQRDGAYHQGTVWPWWSGPFIEAWVRVRGDTAAAKAEAKTRFFDSLTARLHVAGLGHLAEIADAEPPHTPRGCPFQAWSLGEYLRLQEVVLR